MDAAYVDNAGAHCPEQLVIKINALYLALFPTYKIDHLINETGIMLAAVILMVLVLLT
jgi:hypothetical protein